VRTISSRTGTAGMSAWEDHGLLSLGWYTSFAAGDVLLGHDLAEAHAALIRRGIVKVTTVTGAGDELLAIRGAGDLIGEEEALLTQPGSGSASTRLAIALTAGNAIVFPAAQLRQHIEDHPAALLRIARGLCERLGDAEARIAAAARENADRRLARFLHEVCQLTRHGIPAQAARDPEIPVRLSQAELASRIGVSRETVDRALRKWRERGIVSTGHRKIVVRDTEALARIAGSQPSQ
jgi:CRP/FNR family transcriptional regulator, cyclic AMP receptor protein